MIGSENGNGGVGILLAKEWMEKVYDICRISDCLIMIKLAIENNITVLLCYAPQVGLDNTIKDAFYDLFYCTVANDYEGVHGDHSYGLRNTEGERTILLLQTHISTRKIII